MIRFSAALVVVAIGVLIAGVATSSLLLVYVAIGISASGNSPNVINALRMARGYHAATIGLLGTKGGKIKDMVDAYVLAPGQNIEQEEDAHLILAHVITRYMRHVAHLYVRTEPDGLFLRPHQTGVS